MLLEAAGTEQVIKQAAEYSCVLGLFVRCLVGLDRETAKVAFSQFIAGTMATAAQMEFVGLIC